MILLILQTAFNLSSNAAYTCRPENRRNGVSYLDAQGKVWDVADLEFENTSYLDSYLACMRFVESLPEAMHLSASLFPLEPRSQNLARLDLSDPLPLYCLASPGCKLHPVYGFFRPFQFIKSILKPGVLEGLNACQAKTPEFPPHDETKELSDPVPAFQSVDLGRVISIPEQNMEEWLLNELRVRKPKEVVISSMILSAAIMKSVNDWLVKNPESEVWAFFSFGLQSLTPEFPDGFLGLSHRLHWVPVFQTSANSETFHIKGVALKGKTASTWIYSANLRRFREEKVADRIIEIKGGIPYRSFIGILRRVLEEQCTDVEQLACSTGLRFGVQADRSKLVGSWVEGACSSKTSFGVDDANPSMKAAFFEQGGDERVETGILNAVENAKKTIEVSSHILNDSRVTDALLDAADRGIQVKVLVGTEPGYRRWLKRPSRNFVWFKRTRGAGTTSHAKFMVVDRELAIWGTGNFTQTGLHNPHEIFLFSKDQKFIRVLLDYLEFYSGSEPGAS
ncbi:MAG: hypothetical protein KGP28_07140 [Bdellovibrionales bacterium]|nr:hypothetical protein [Bdellovibrionales bacterium]